MSQKTIHKGSPAAFGSDLCKLCREISYRYFYLTAFLIFISSYPMDAQNRTGTGLGISAIHPQSIYAYAAVEDLVFESFPDNYAEGLRFSVYHDIYSKNRSTIKAEAGYFFPIGYDGSVYKVYKVDYSTNFISWLESYTPDFHIVDITSYYSYNLFWNIRPYIGGGVWYLYEWNPSQIPIYDYSNEPEEFHPYYIEENRKREAIIAVQNSHKQLLLSGLVGLSYTYRKFTVTIRYERSLSFLGESLKFNGNTYPFMQHIDRLSLGIQYDLFGYKQKD